MGLRGLADGENLVNMFEVRCRVCDEQNCRTARPISDGAKQVVHFPGKARVKARSRLIEDEQFWLGKEFHANGYAALLSAGEVLDLLVLLLVQPELVENFGDSLPSIFLIHFGPESHKSGEIERFPHGQLFDQIGLLGHKAVQLRVDRLAVHH